LPILIVQEDRFAPIAPAQHMIEGALILDAASPLKTMLTMTSQPNSAHMHGLL
jgi:hypothetical protein